MSKLLSLFIAICIFPLFSFNYNEEEALGILEQYSPGSYEVVSLLPHIPEKYGKSKPGQNTMSFWLKKDNPSKYLASFSTGVHECFHGYCGLSSKYFLEKENKNTDGKFYHYFITSGETYIVKCTDVFPAAEMATAFSFGMKFMRFSSYISPSDPDQSTQQDGVYALLDEFNAYYMGLKVLLDIMPYIKKELAPDAENWANIFQYLNSDYGTYPEFRFYIVNYMLFAKTNHPETYNRIIENKEFLKALKAVDNAYAAQVERYRKMKPELVEYLKNSGVDISDSDVSISIGTEGIDNYFNVYSKTGKEFVKEKYKDVLSDLGL